MEQRSEQTKTTLRGHRVTVSAIVAAYNEERYIGRCLNALLAQQRMFGSIEILVIDGGSTDGTRAIVRSFPEYGTTIRLIENRRRLQVYAWNIGLRQMCGQYYAMLTAHAEYAPDYFEKCLETLERTGAAAVGGVPRAYGEGRLGRAIAFCMSSPFGVGNARFRYLKREEECDTVPLIFAARETVQAAGGWDERISFDEDSDMSYRLRERGGKLVVSPEIGVRYYVRRSLKSLWKQLYQYGYWRRVTQLKHPQSVPLRVLAPVALLGGLAASAMLAATPLRPVAAIVPICYAAFMVTGMVCSVKRVGPSAFCIPAVMATMHAGYGVGYLNAFCRRSARAQRSPA
ncbi:MAG: glycosyltransferase family 2 protein [Candidatus Baltobacteraceae bacterium]